MQPDQAARLFRAIDEQNADAFVSFLTPEGTFRFANAPAVKGRAAVHEAVAGFFGAIAGSKHRMIHLWNDGDDVAIHGEVTYTRKDEKNVTVPFVNVFRMKGDAIDEYLVHVDTAPLFA